MKRISGFVWTVEICVELIFAALWTAQCLGENQILNHTETSCQFDLKNSSNASLMLPVSLEKDSGRIDKTALSPPSSSESSSLNLNLSETSSAEKLPTASASSISFDSINNENFISAGEQPITKEHGIQTVSDSEKTVTVSESEWRKLVNDLETIKQEMADDKAKAKLKKEEEELKKYRTPSWKLNGVMIWDGAFSEHDDGAEMATGNDGNSGSKVRQAWLDFSGSMYDMIKYRFTYDFSNKTTKDFWIGLFNTPSGADLKVGHMKEPWSGEELTVVAATAFIEKSYLNDLRGIHGSRNNGILFSNWSTADRFSWAAGVFAASMKEDDLSCVSTDQNYAFTGRVTYLPYFQENHLGQKFLLHLGASYSYRKYDQKNAEKLGTKCSFLSNSQIAPNALTTGTMTGLDSMNALGIEVFLVRGPFSMDFEQGFFYMEDDLAGNVFLPAGYFQVTYTLTGESRNYSKDGGRYKKLKPNNPFIRTCRDGVGVFTGPGAWEIGYMCTWVDASELASGYATETHHTGLLGKSLMNIWGLNWYLNENCRVMLNYALIHTDYSGFNTKGVNIDGTDGWEHVIGTRFQVTF
ncbi:MAG: hypothetical protein E7028_02725 [Planctomycetaceae bacterium]|nr:hypothetical protein [Planctomycetaceae bacterium]